MAKQSKVQAFLSLLAESGNTGFFSYSPATQRVDADAASCRLLQRANPATASLHDFLAAVHVADRAALVEEVQRTVATQGAFTREFRLSDGGDSGLSIRARWSALPDDSGGEIHGMVERSLSAPPEQNDTQQGRASAIVTESSERKEILLDDVRQSLALSEARYKLLSEASFEGVGLARDGIVVDANEQIAKILGVPRHDLIGKPVTRNMKPADVPKAMQAFKVGGDSFNEYEYLRPDGTRIIVEVNSKDLVQGDQVLRISALRDITQRKQREMALHHMQMRFTSMMDSNVVGLFVAGADGEILEANDYFLNMLGLSRTALESGQLNWRRLSTADTLDITVHNVQQMQQTGGSRPYEKDYVHANGHTVSALVALSRMDGDPARGIVIVVDISGLKAAQTALQRSNAQLTERTLQAERAEAAKTMFLSSVSHELRTPLHTILGHVRLMRKKASGDELHQLRVVEQSSSHLLRLIEDLLAFNHAAIEPEQLMPEVVVLEGFLANLDSIGSTAAAESGNAYFSQLGNDLPTAVVVDEGRLVQVLRILIDNACKYTRSGVVLFSLSVEGDEDGAEHADPSGRCRLRFSVEDNGRGIDPPDKSRIFEPLNRGSNAGDRAGLGLGLAIAAQWVGRMGSSIALETTRGVGSRFSFLLDLEANFDPAPTRGEVPRSGIFSVQSAGAEVDFQPLPVSELITLGQLINMGRLGRLHDWARDLGLRYPEHVDAAKFVAELAGNAELDALEALHRRWEALAWGGASNNKQTKN